ncbi:MAG: hypothetical protein ABSC72_11075 [Methylovirgula sp.]|jgi:hypothetical protein
MIFGLFVSLAALCRDMTPEREHGRSFGAFLKGEVEIATGRISGKAALLQIVAMPVALSGPGGKAE